MNDRDPGRESVKTIDARLELPDPVHIGESVRAPGTCVCPLEGCAVCVMPRMKSQEIALGKRSDSPELMAVVYMLFIGPSKRGTTDLRRPKLARALSLFSLLELEGSSYS